MSPLRHAVAMVGDAWRSLVPMGSPFMPAECEPRADEVAMKKSERLRAAGAKPVERLKLAMRAEKVLHGELIV
jgi:hypothetical protein